MTIEEWCITNDHMDYIELWDEKRNDIQPNEVASHTKKRVYIKCPRGLHESRGISCDQLTCLKGGTCLQCNSFAQSTIDKYGEEYFWKIWSDKNETNPFTIPRSGTKKVWLKCTRNPEHGEFLTKCNKFSTKKDSWTCCPKCHVRGGKTIPAFCDSLQGKRPECARYWSSLNHISPSDVTAKSHIAVLWKCPEGKHDDFKRSVAESARYDFRCPICSVERKSSMLQSKVRSYIMPLGYTVLNEYECNILPERKWMKNNRYLPCDNEVVELKLIVEVNGRQHYIVNSWHKLQGKRRGTSAEYEFKMSKMRDMFKKWYVIENGYDYLAIPYTAEADESYKLLIDEKINEITAKESVTTTA